MFEQQVCLVQLGVFLDLSDNAEPANELTLFPIYRIVAQHATRRSLVISQLCEDSLLLQLVCSLLCPGFPAVGEEVTPTVR